MLTMSVTVIYVVERAFLFKITGYFTFLCVGGNYGTCSVFSLLIEAEGERKEE